MISIRVMGLPAEAGRAVIAITASPDLDVDSIRGPYVNRNDAQVRIYVNAEIIPPDTRPAAEFSRTSRGTGPRISTPESEH